jgi:hypothetical protein
MPMPCCHAESTMMHSNGQRDTAASSRSQSFGPFRATSATRIPWLCNALACIPEDTIPPSPSSNMHRIMDLGRKRACEHSQFLASSFKMCFCFNACGPGNTSMARLNGLQIGATSTQASNYGACCSALVGFTHSRRSLRPPLSAATGL